MNMGSMRGGFTPISLPDSPTLLGGSPSTIPLERITTADSHAAVQEGVSLIIYSLPIGSRSLVFETVWKIIGSKIRRVLHLITLAILPDAFIHIE